MFLPPPVLSVCVLFLSCSLSSVGSGRVPAASGLQEESESPLHRAIAQGDREEVASLLASGVGINERDERGFTPLEEALASGDFDLFVYLVEQGADLRRTTRGWGLLHFAAFYGRSDVASFLLERNLPVDARSTPTLETPLHVAAGVQGHDNRQLEVLRVLINGGAGLDLVDDLNRRASEVAYDRGNGALGDFLTSQGGLR